MAIEKAIRALALFSELDGNECRKLSGLCEVRNYAAGELVFDEGLIGHSLQIIRKGSVEISFMMRIPEKEAASSIATLYPGRFFGMFTFLDPNRHSATARALETTETISLSKEDFEKFCREDPYGGYLILHKLALSITNMLRLMDEKVADMFSYVWGDNATF
ncbi:MAG: Crp/Fnr family transcriptional regulator [bacterium]